MAGKKFRVLVVDDSALVRELISDTLLVSDELELAGTAKNGREALDLFAQLRPDVITLDIQMPVMDGLTTLRELLRLHPVPVVMVSATTRLGAEITLEALEMGAIDYVTKPEGGTANDKVWQEEFLRKVRSAASANVTQVLAIRTRHAEQRKQRQAATAQRSEPTTVAPPRDFADKLIALGISTGGPPALSELFEQLQGPLPPIVIVQHMPAHFTKQFAGRLNSLSRLTCKEAETGDILEPNHAYIAAGGFQLEILPHGRGGKLRVREGELVSGHRPSVDVMMTSAAKIYGDRCLGIIMTGMGRDGADGCKLIKQAGGYVLGQDEKTSDVYGMNRVAFVEGGVDKQFPLSEGAGVISQTVKRLWVNVLAGV